MKQAFLNGSGAVTLWVLLFAPTGCRELTTVDRSYQRVVVNDFSAPLRTLLPAFNGSPSSITLQISGTVSQPVTLVINQLVPGQGRQLVRRDTLAAGTYTDRYIGGDYYSREETELVVTGAPGATGSLTIDWHRY